MLNKIKKNILEMVNDKEFADFLSRPINEGKHYHIGGVTELLDHTSEVTDEDIIEIISEKITDIPEESFTVEYYLDLGSNRDVTGSMLLMVQKISPNNLIVFGYVGEGGDIAVNPVFAIIPLQNLDLDRRSKDFMDQFLTSLSDDGVREEFVDFLEGCPRMSSNGDVFYFSIAGDEISDSRLNGIVEDLKSSVIDILFRFILLKKQGVEVKVTPNTTIETTGRLKIRDISKDCYIIKFPDEKGYLGFSRY